MTVTIEQATLLLRLLQEDDANNRLNDLEREPEFEALEAKLVSLVRGN